MANSGSKFGSMPGNPDVDGVVPVEVPSSFTLIIGLDIKMSDKMCGPGGIVTKWLLSELFTAEINVSNFSMFWDSSPKLITSTATLFFQSFS